jgi:hypothetical protein
METASFCPSGPPICGDETFLGVCLKFGLGIFLQKLAKKSKCREKRLSGNQVLHRDVPEFLHIPPAFPENLVNSIQKKLHNSLRQLLATWNSI